MIKKLVLALIKLYQVTRPLRLPCCRFYPSCSDYLAACVQSHGLARGFMLGFLRILRCHPFTSGGVDEIPQNAALFRLKERQQ